MAPTIMIEVQKTTFFGDKRVWRAKEPGWALNAWYAVGRSGRLWYGSRIDGRKAFHGTKTVNLPVETHLSEHLVKEIEKILD